MRSNQYIKGETTEAKFASLERVLKHFRRRLYSTIISAAPPMPISAYVKNPVDRDLLRYIFSVKGKVRRGCLFVERFTDNRRKSTAIVVELVSEFETRYKTFPVRRGLSVVDLELSVAVGDRLVVGLENPQEVEGIWVGFLYDIDPKEMSQERVSIDHLEKLIGENEEEKDDENR